DEVIRSDGAFTEPVASPAVTGVGVGGILESVTSEGMKNVVLDGFDGGREIGDVMLGIGIEADDDSVGEKVGNFFVREEAVEYVVVNTRIKILAEAADGLGGAEDRAADAALIEFHQGPVPFLNFDEAILNCHARASI